MTRDHYNANARRYAPVVDAMKELGFQVLAVEDGLAFKVAALLSGRPWLVLVGPRRETVTKPVQRQFDALEKAGVVVAVVKDAAGLREFVAGN